jgi:hypothetical protein
MQAQKKRRECTGRECKSWGGWLVVIGGTFASEKRKQKAGKEEIVEEEA